MDKRLKCSASAPPGGPSYPECKLDQTDLNTDSKRILFSKYFYNCKKPPRSHSSLNC